MVWKMLLLNLVPKPHRRPFFYSAFLGRARRTWGREQLVQLFCFYSFFPWYFYQDLQLWEIPSCLLDSINILALSSELKDTVRQESFLLFSSSFSVAVYEMLWSLAHVQQQHWEGSERLQEFVFQNYSFIVQQREYCWAYSELPRVTYVKTC